eukprot:COSAG06_NODE_7355_length_2533_cov_3.375103_1_plen_115_part_10
MRARRVADFESFVVLTPSALIGNLVGTRFTHCMACEDTLNPGHVRVCVCACRRDPSKCCGTVAAAAGADGLAADLHHAAHLPPRLQHVAVRAHSLCHTANCIIIDHFSAFESGLV